MDKTAFRASPDTVTEVPLFEGSKSTATFREKIAFKAKLVKFGHDHPTAMKVILIAAAILGAVALAGLIVGAAILSPSLIAVGALGVALATTGLALTILNLVEAKKAGVAPHDMGVHHYPEITITYMDTEQELQITPATMTYQGDVPVLTLDYVNNTSFNVGVAQGAMFATQIVTMLDKYSDMPAFRTLREQMNRTLYSCVSEDMNVPGAYRSEMDGIVQGCNSELENQGFSKRIDIRDIFTMNLLPDSYHLLRGVQMVSDDDSVACTSVIQRESDGGLVFARNMDWHAAQVLGPSQCMIERVLPGGKRVMQVGIPGMVGAVTGLNSRGLTVAMNVCNTRSPEFNLDGMPSTFLNRSILENYDSLEDLESMQFNTAPLAPYHLAVSDGKSATVIHYGQGNGGIAGLPSLRESVDEAPLVTTNRGYFDKEGETTHVESGEDRELEIARFYATAAGREDGAARRALALPRVNNSGTSHTMVARYSPVGGVPAVGVRFDNGFSGEGALHSVVFTGE